VQGGGEQEGGDGVGRGEGRQGPEAGQMKMVVCVCVLCVCMCVSCGVVESPPRERELRPSSASVGRPAG